MAIPTKTKRRPVTEVEMINLLHDARKYGSPQKAKRALVKAMYAVDWSEYRQFRNMLADYFEQMDWVNREN